MASHRYPHRSHAISEYAFFILYSISSHCTNLKRGTRTTTTARYVRSIDDTTLLTQSSVEHDKYEHDQHKADLKKIKEKNVQLSLIYLKLIVNTRNVNELIHSFIEMSTL